MKSWFRFIGNNKRLLNFGFLFNFFSSFGQTFFISLFVPFWVKSLGITNTAFGSIYSIITIISAFLLSLSGSLIDKMSLKKYGLIVFSGLMLSVILLSQAYNITVLILGLLLIRWFGQGLMTHTSVTGIAKSFENNSGHALGFTALGNPAGQFVFPLLTIPLISLAGWRLSLIYMAFAASVFVIPALWAIRSFPRSVSCDSEKQPEIMSENGHYFRSMKFWIIALNAFIIPFITTAVFLYQYTIGQIRGWDSSWVAFSFAFYAVFNALALLLSGILTNKYSGVYLFPLYLIPAFTALIIMPFIESKWIFPLFYAFLGISGGMGSTIKTVVLVDIYGTKDLGRIRSYFSTFLVLSTALGPPVFGYFLDRQYPISNILIFAGICVLIIMLLSFRLWKYRTA